MKKPMGLVFSLNPFALRFFSVNWNFGRTCSFGVTPIPRSLSRADCKSSCCAVPSMVNLVLFFSTLLFWDWLLSKIESTEKMGGSCSSSESKDSKRLQLAIANSKLIRIMLVSPAPGYEIEIHELENVLALLEKFALLLGLNRSAARSLQLEFAETTLAHELQLEPAGLCDESLCSVLR